MFAIVLLGMGMVELKIKRVSDEAFEIGRNLREIRLWKGCSQLEIAKVLGVTAQQIHKYEAGENRLPIEKLFILRVFFDIPYDAFFKGVLEPDFVSENIHTRFPSMVMYKMLGQIKDKNRQDRIMRVIEALVS